MQGTEHQVAGFRRREGETDGFKVAHFADQDHVRILAQRRLQRIGERQHMGADFALVDQAFLRLMYEFDRVFNGQNVAEVVFVDVIDHRRKRGGLAGTGRAGHQHDAARRARDLGKNLRAVQLLQRQHLVRNGTEYGGGAAMLDEGIDAEACQVGHGEREVDVEVFLIHLALTVVHDVIHHGVYVLVLQRRQVDAAHVAMNANHRRQPGRQMQVGCLVFDGEGQQFGNVHTKLFLIGLGE